MMKQQKIVLTTHFHEGNKLQGYLGSDGLTLNDSHNLYLRKCAEFQTKAKRYNQDNMYIKNSILHHNKFGYNNSEEAENEVLLERNHHMENYNKIFDLTLFNEDPNLMYKNVFGQNKKIRIIRELNTERIQDFSENFDTERKSWFTRYCILSTFIQAGRIIIVKNRLKKVLNKLKLLTPDLISKIEKEIVKEKGETEESISKHEEIEKKHTATTAGPCKNIFSLCEKKIPGNIK